MCQRNCQSLSEKLYNTMLDNGGKMTFYKVIRRNDFRTFPQAHWIGTYQVSYVYKKNINRYKTNCDRQLGLFNNVECVKPAQTTGIHVFLTKKDAEDMKNSRELYSGSRHLVIPVTCYAKDFVSAGVMDSTIECETAVFTKIHIGKTAQKLMRENYANACNS